MNSAKTPKVKERGGGAVKSILLLFGILFFCALFLEGTAPTNYFTTNDVRTNLPEWTAHGVDISLASTDAVASYGFAAKIRADVSDSHIVITGLDMPRGSVTFSVFLRAEKPENILIQVGSGNEWSRKKIEISSEWKRYQITGRHYDSEAVKAFIGGGASFYPPGTIYAYGLQLSEGPLPTNYTPPVVSTQLSALQLFICNSRLRSNSDYLFVVPAVLLMLVSIAMLLVVQLDRRSKSGTSCHEPVTEKYHPKCAQTKNPAYIFRALSIFLAILIPLAATAVVEYYLRRDLGLVVKESNIFDRFATNRFIRLREQAPGFDAYIDPSAAITRAEESDSLVIKPYRLRAETSGFVYPSFVHKDDAQVQIQFYGGSTTESAFVDELSRFPYLVGRYVEGD